VPISAKGNNCGRVRTSQPALTDQLDLVAVTNAPVPVDLVGLLRPVVCTALLSRSLVQLVNNNLSTNAHDECGNDYVGSNKLGHRKLLVVRCPSPLRASLMGGIEPPFAPAIS